MQTMLITTLGLVLLTSTGTRTEDFDQAGSDWSSTIFPELVPSGDGTFSREPLTGDMRAPNTSPPLPINVGGDKEGRYYDAGVAPSASYAIMDNSGENWVVDSTIEAYLAIGNPDPFGSRTGGLLLRATPGDPGLVNAYCVYLSHSSGSSAVVRLLRIRNSLIRKGDLIAASEPFTVDLDRENYRLFLRARGAKLVASIWRVRVVDGAVVEEPIDLLDEAGVQNTLMGTDGTWPLGKAGLYAFSRQDNGVFWDDVRVNLCPIDIDGSGEVDFQDIVRVLDAWGGGGGPADVDASGTVGFEDLVRVLDAWGPCE